MATDQEGISSFEVLPSSEFDRILSFEASASSEDFFDELLCLILDPSRIEVLTAIGNFCIYSIAVGMIMEIIVMFPIQHHPYRSGVNNLRVLLIGGIPIAMPTVLSVTLAIGSHRLSQQGAITKRMTAIEEMAGMDVLCSDKTGNLTLNCLTVGRNLIEVLKKEIDADTMVLLATRASRLENQDAIDTTIVNMLDDPKEARPQEVHFLPFNPVDKRTAITYIDSDGCWWRTSKGAPKRIINIVQRMMRLLENSMPSFTSLQKGGITLGKRINHDKYGNIVFELSGGKQSNNVKNERTEPQCEMDPKSGMEAKAVVRDIQRRQVIKEIFR